MTEKEFRKILVHYLNFNEQYMSDGGVDFRKIEFLCENWKRIESSSPIVVDWIYIYNINYME